MFLGSTIGSFLPMLLNQALLSIWSVVGSGIGGLLGMWGGYRLGEDFLG